MPKYMPCELYAEVYGEYVPRLCVDTVVLRPQTECSGFFHGMRAHFALSGPNVSIALIQRDIPPKLGTWHLPGGVIRKGERVEDAAKRLVFKELGIQIGVLGTLPFIEFPDEVGQVEVDGQMRSLTYDSISVVLLARALSPELHGSTEGKNIGWFSRVPHGPEHPEHIPYLVKYGFLMPRW